MSVIAVEWTDENSGVINGTPVIISGLSGHRVVEAKADPEEELDNPLSGGNYLHPLPDGTKYISYNTGSQWSMSFDSPVDDLVLYAIYWRGCYGRPISPDTNMIYTFDQEFEIISGMHGLTGLKGKVLTLPTKCDVTGYFSGMLRFADGISSLSCAVNSDSGSAIGFNLGLLQEKPAELRADEELTAFVVSQKETGAMKGPETDLIIQLLQQANSFIASGNNAEAKTALQQAQMNSRMGLIAGNIVGDDYRAVVDQATIIIASLG